MKHDVNVPLFSIIIPVYNGEKYLCRCLDSVLNQTFSDYEVLLIDDGSTDKSGQICEEYADKDKRIHVFHQENGGLSAARNSGIEETKGDYIVFIDSDDHVDPKLLEKAYERLNDDPDLLTLGYRQIETDGSIIIRNDTLWEYEVKTDKDLYDYMLNYLFTRKVGWEAWSQIYRRSLIGDLRFTDTKKVFSEDLCFTLCYLAGVRKIASVPGQLYIYEKKAGSLSQPLVPESEINRMSCCAHEVYDHYLKQDDRKYITDNFPLIYFSIIRVEIDKARSLLKRKSYQELRRIFKENSDREFYERMLKRLPEYHDVLKKLPHKHATYKTLNMLKMLEGEPYFLFRIKDLFLDLGRSLLLFVRRVLWRNGNE